MNGDAEWNRWRGHTGALLENMDKTLIEVQKEVTRINKELGRLKKEYYVFYGKAIGLGIAASIIVTIILKFIPGIGG
jgi:peptide deformylase